VNQPLLDLWKRQLEEGTQAWVRLMSQAPGGAAGTAPPVDPQAFWKPFMDQGIAAWSKVMSQGPASPELMTQWKQFLDQWIAAWSRVLEQTMGTEAFAQVLGRQLEASLTAGGPAKKAADQQLEAGLASLGLPSRAQLIGVAQQIAQLEEKIEGVEDKLDAVLKRLDEVAPAVRRDAR
jgi:poly(hydroxyalkanoate) synthase III subunit E